MAREFIDLLGQHFGGLTVLKLVRQRKPRRWLCLCKCGQTRIARQDGLRGGRYTMCLDCTWRRRPPAHVTHGLGKPPEYNSWLNMRRRCYETHHPKYSDYGGRGIYVCERWRNNFKNFYEDLGPRPTRFHTIERVDNDGSYTPNNCRWATAKEQAANRRPLRRSRTGRVLST